MKGSRDEYGSIGQRVCGSSIGVDEATPRDACKPDAHAG
jgi:hypothetical protein